MGGGQLYAYMYIATNGLLFLPSDHWIGVCPLDSPVYAEIYIVVSDSPVYVFSRLPVWPDLGGWSSQNYGWGHLFLIYHLGSVCRDVTVLG